MLQNRLKQEITTSNCVYGNFVIGEIQLKPELGGEKRRKKNRGGRGKKPGEKQQGKQQWAYFTNQQIKHFLPTYIYLASIQYTASVTSKSPIFMEIYKAAFAYTWGELVEELRAWLMKKMCYHILKTFFKTMVSLHTGVKQF